MIIKNDTEALNKFLELAGGHPVCSDYDCVETALNYFSAYMNSYKLLHETVLEIAKDGNDKAIKLLDKCHDVEKDSFLYTIKDIYEQKN